jgi:hemolysin activation/secretion protein
MRGVGRLSIAVLAIVFASSALAQVGTPPPTPRFAIERYVVEGNSLLTQAELDALFAPFSGANRDFGDVQRALEALQSAYADRGYSAVRVVVPEQDLVGGRVRIQVVEARIRQVRVEGNRFFSSTNVRAGLPSLKEGTSPNTRRLGENLQLVNENPAKLVRVQLQAAEEEGKVDAAVRVEESDPSRITVFADNTGTPQTGRYRAGVGYLNANVADRDHVFNAQVITSPTKARDVVIAGFGYRIPVYAWQGTFEALAGYSDVSSGTVQNLFTVSGKGSILGLKYNQLLPHVDGYEQKLTLGWDYRAYRNSVVLIGTTESLVPDITVRPLSLTYTGRMPRVGSDLSLFLSYSRNLAGGPNGDQDAFTAQRAGATAKYAVWRYGAGYTYTLSGDYLLRAAANGQTTRDLLTTAEQFGMGGMDSVRGYLERETANDVGRRISLEGYSPDFGARIGSTWRSRALLFIDAASGSDREPVRTEPNRLQSYGLGLRASQGKLLTLRIDIAHVTKAAGTRDEGSNKAHFALAYSF